MVRDAAVPHPRVRVADPQRRHRAPAQRRGRVDRVARGHPGETPPRPGAEVAGPLRDHGDVGAEYVPRREQPVCTVTVSRSPPNDCPVVTVAASQPASRKYRAGT
jgi:hypothetical protein